MFEFFFSHDANICTSSFRSQNYKNEYTESKTYGTIGELTLLPSSFKN